MEETLRGDQRSVQLVFEADRHAEELLSKIYERLLVPGAGNPPDVRCLQARKVVDSEQPVLTEVGA